jgi:soluble lytic murein transglycosylase-like protein
LLPLFRAVLVWLVILVTVVLPRVDPAPQQSLTAAVASVTTFDRNSVVQEAKSRKVHAAQMAQVQVWSSELKQGLAEYQAKQEALAAAQAQAAEIAARANHPAPPPDIAMDITDAFSPLGPAAVQWAMNVAWCESRYHPNSVNSSSGASGLFQFLPSTWAFTPYASQSPFDPKYNALAAAWLYNRDGPSQWVCQG